MTVRCVTHRLFSGVIQRVSRMVHVLSWEGRFKTCSKHWENKAVSDLFQIWIYIKKSDKVAGRWDVLSRTVRISGLLGVLWFVFFFS